MNPQSPEPLQSTSQPAAMNLPAPVAQQASQPALPPMPTTPQVAPASSQAAAAAAAIPAASLPTAADDQDLIEKEWVSKAKQIVDKTRNDPYEQTKQLNAFKSDYMQKRYNKTIKLGD